MNRFLLLFILAIEIFALGNRGGGPLLSHLLLTGITFLALAACAIFGVKLRFKLGWTAIFSAAFFIFFGLSFITSQTSNFGLSELFLFANAGLLFFLFSALDLDEKELRFFSSCLIALAVLDTLFGFFIYIQTPFPRFAGTFLDLAAPYTSFANDYANFLLLVLPLAFWRFFGKHERIGTTILFGLATAVLMAGFLLSFSRGAWISLLALGPIVLFGFALRKKQIVLPVSRFNFAVRFFGGAALVVLLVMGLQTVRAKKFPVNSLLLKASFAADEGTASANERLDFWKGAIKIIKEQPLFGSGILSFKFLYPKYQPTFGTNWDHPHNIFLKMAVENGLIATGFFLLFLLSVAAAILRFFWKEPAHPSLFFAAGALASLGHNLVDFNFIVANFTLFIIFISIAFSFFLKSYNLQPTPYFLRPLLLISFFLLLLGFHEALGNRDFKLGRAAFAAGNTDVAIPLLERSQNLFFPRDLQNYLSLAYAEKFQKTHDPAWLHKQKTSLAVASASGLDAAAIAILGDIALEEKSYALAENLFGKSLRLDPQNHLHYYYGFLNTLELQKKAPAPEFRTKILALLEEYKTVLAQNRHMTIITENPKYASKLYGLFGMKKEQEEIDALWFDELVKFSLKYGAPTVSS